MKKVLITILVVIAILLAVGVAGAVGYIWYQENHVFVEETAYRIDSESLDLREEEISLAHYDELQRKLPQCDILWMVPFQNGKQSNDIQSLTLTALSREDMQMLSYFPQLKEIVADFDDYAILEELKAVRPDLDVKYSVSIGEASVHPESTWLELVPMDFDYEILMANLIHLPKMEKVTLRWCELTLEQVEALRTAYTNITFSCTVELMGQELDMETTELDLCTMTPEQVPEVAAKLPLLPKLAAVDLAGCGASQLSKEDVKQLLAAAPNAVFDYTFEFFGQTLSTADEEVSFKNVRMGDDAEAELRLALDLLPNCKRFVLDNCHFSYDVLAKVRDDYRHQTKVVWRVSYGEGSTLTDAEVIRAVYDLVDDNCHNLIYCEDAKYMDIGHNEWLDGCDFVSGMKSLEYVIISGAPIKSLEPFRNCKNLKFLEIAFCEYVTDVSPLADCKNLQMLNISNTHVTDLSPLDDLPLTHLTVRNNPSGKCRLSQEEQNRVIAQHPDCWISFSGKQPYGAGWRYDEDDITPLDHYKVVRIVFRLALDPNIPNHVGWYLKDQEREEVEKLEEAMDAVLAQMQKSSTVETVTEETVPQVTIPDETVPEETTENA